MTPRPLGLSGIPTSLWSSFTGRERVGCRRAVSMGQDAGLPL